MISTKQFFTIWADAIGVSQDAGRATYARFRERILSILKNDGEIVLPDLGKFHVSDFREHDSVNPKTGEKMVVPKRKRVHFKAFKSLKETLLEETK